MRQRHAFTLAAGGRWPGPDGGRNLPQFNWVKIDNKGTGSVDVSLSANPTAGDKIDTMLTVPAGVCRVFNVAGPQDGGAAEPSGSGAWPQEISLVSAAGTTVYMEIADHPIVDLQAVSGGASTGAPTFTRLEDGASTTAATVLAAPGDSLAIVNPLETAAMLYAWDGGGETRVRLASAGTASASPVFGPILMAPPGTWSAASAAAVGVASSASRAAGGVGVRHFCEDISFGFSATTALAGITTVTVNLRDGATGAGTILKTWQFTLPAAVVAPFAFVEPGLAVTGSANTAMTLEFSAAVGNLLTFCNLGGYDLT